MTVNRQIWRCGETGRLGCEEACALVLMKTPESQAQTQALRSEANIGRLFPKSTRQICFEQAKPLPRQVLFGHAGWCGTGNDRVGWGMKHFLKSAAFGAAFTIALCGGAGAQTGSGTLSGVTADQLESVLADAGLNPDMLADSATGAPVAQGKAGQFGFYVRALSCSGAPKACETLVFFANFKLGRDVAPGDYRIVNSFNDSQVFGRAYVLEGTGEVGVDYVIELNGGVTEEHLSQNIARWADVISAFVSKFQDGEGAVS